MSQAAPFGFIPAFAVLLGAVAGGLWWFEQLTLPLVIHAALMTTAWAGIMPMGALIARYGKVTRHQRFPDELDNRFWWNWHRGLQYAGVALSAVGLVAVLGVTGGGGQTTHGQYGLALALLSVVQVAGAALRGTKGGPTDEGADPGHPETWRGDHFDMTRRRVVFEAVHKTLGWSTLAGAGVVILLGVQLVGAPGWLLAVLGAAYLTLAMVAFIQASSRRRVTTYAAIWGPHLRSPLLRPVRVEPRDARPAGGKGTAQ